MKGLIVGPIHVSTADQFDDLNLTEIAPSAGSLSDLETFIKAAHKKGEFLICALLNNVKCCYTMKYFLHNLVLLQCSYAFA